MASSGGRFSGLFTRSLSIRLRLHSGVVMLIALLTVPALIFFGLLAFALLLLAALAVVVAGLYLHDCDERTRHSVEASAALLSSLALLAAGYWYFIERPRVPKLVPHPELEAWAIGEGMALARVSVGLENVGGTEIVLDDRDPIEIEIGQILPATGAQLRELAEGFRTGRAAGKKAFGVLQTDKWPLRAGIVHHLDVVIEAGETERLHYKAIVPCERGLLLVTAKVPKRMHWFDDLFAESRHENLYWVAQSVAPAAITKCKGEKVR